MAPFHGWGSTISRLQSHFEETFYFFHSTPKTSWYSFNQPQEDKRLSKPWSHPVVLNLGLLDWETSALTTKPLVVFSVVGTPFVKRWLSFRDFPKKGLGLVISILINRFQCFLSLSIWCAYVCFVYLHHFCKYSLCFMARTQFF